MIDTEFERMAERLAASGTTVDRVLWFGFAPARTVGLLAKKVEWTGEDAPGDDAGRRGRITIESLIGPRELMRDFYRQLGFPASPAWLSLEDGDRRTFAGHGFLVRIGPSFCSGSPCEPDRMMVATNLELLVVRQDDGEGI